MKCNSDCSRIGILVKGAVQGVGFRPFVYRIAHKHNVSGFVQNRLDGVYIEVQGGKETIEKFISDLHAKYPKHAKIEDTNTIQLEIKEHEEGFRIHVSDLHGIVRTRILPDIATCPDCLREMNDPNDRRYQYPFINCTLCGPRYTIIKRMPYDRVNTSMAHFQMCSDCRKEYEDPSNRRFHAEPTACPVCGPHVYLCDAQGTTIAEKDDAIDKTIQAIREGNIVAIKGLGGFHLVVDAMNGEAVKQLRLRKHREEKPFALMYPSLEELRKDCILSEIEEGVLTSSESPIVLVKKHYDSLRIALEVAPEQDRHGVMLPYTPLHHILLSRLNSPIVATSGNRSDEPICIDEYEALNALSGIADYFLVHNRPILRHVDDSIIQVVLEKPVVLRRARGYVPQPVYISEAHFFPVSPILAVGAHLKNTVAICSENQVVISQHLGDLETQKAVQGFYQSCHILTTLVEQTPELLVADAHPDYASTYWAQQQGKPIVYVQHHIAHALSVIAEKGVSLPVFAVSWDGTGFGLDHTVWGGEFFIITETEVQRWGHFRTFPLPGGDKAVREPRRSALGILYEIYRENIFQMSNEIVSLVMSAFTDTECKALKQMLRNRINTPLTSSVGRLFDAMAMFLGLRAVCSYEAQSAMQLEVLARKAIPYPLPDVPFTLRKEDNEVLIDWQPIFEYVFNNMKEVPPEILAFHFHQYLAQYIRKAVEMVNIKNVVINGGCFQNRLLLEYTYNILCDDYNVFFAEQIPPNDGGISLGQVYYALKYHNINMEK